MQTIRTCWDCEKRRRRESVAPPFEQQKPSEDRGSSTMIGLPEVVDIPDKAKTDKSERISRLRDRRRGSGPVRRKPGRGTVKSRVVCKSEPEAPRT